MSLISHNFDVKSIIFLPFPKLLEKALPYCCLNICRVSLENIFPDQIFVLEMSSFCFVIALTFIFVHEYMHQCVNVNICNFAIFGPIIMKFSPNCTAKEMGMSLIIWEFFAYFWIWIRP